MLLSCQILVARMNVLLCYATIGDNCCYTSDSLSCHKVSLVRLVCYSSYVHGPVAGLKNSIVFGPKFFNIQLFKKFRFQA